MIAEAPIIHHVEQGTPEWYAVRAGIPTASELNAIITPLWKARTGEGVETYLSKKIAERWLGRPLESGGAFVMDQGKILEDEAVPFFEMMHDLTIERVGFITTADGKFGCSPDGLIGDDSGIEIKCPLPHTHVGYLTAGVLPKDYAAQVYGGMYATGRSSWKFASYCRLFPALIIDVPRDEQIMDAIHDAIASFNDRLESGFEQLTALKGARANQ